MAERPLDLGVIDLGFGKLHGPPSRFDEPRGSFARPLLASRFPIAHGFKLRVRRESVKPPSFLSDMTDESHDRHDRHDDEIPSRGPVVRSSMSAMSAMRLVGMRQDEPTDSSNTRHPPADSLLSCAHATIDREHR